MTLTELKYIVAVARERHFGRAAEACHVSQPTLSVAIRKLEEELGVQLFERGSVEVSVTPVGQKVVEQAQRVLEESAAIREIARQGQDPLAGLLRVGVIYTIGPYLLPVLVRRIIEDAPMMPLVLQENFTVKLLESLRQGEIDVAILAEPFPDHGFVTRAVYDEPFVVAVPRDHPWARRKSIASSELKQQTMLLLGTGHCFRDQVLEVCPELSRYSQASAGIQKTFEGSSLETIRHMVASGIGITVLPWMAMPAAVLVGRERDDGLLAYVPFEPPPPVRRVVLAWRKSFSRTAAIEALREAILRSELPGVTKLRDVPAGGAGVAITEVAARPAAEVVSEPDPVR
jgi:LysR family transcriptional regulator, hydrogen peroxide-inducible genes activator